MTNINSFLIQRATAALKSGYVADALAMPVHWFYNPQDIDNAFPGSIQKFEDAPAKHPMSFLTLPDAGDEIFVVGNIILKDKRKFWGIPNQHVHQGMKAGENTLNAHCARLVTRTLHQRGGHYDVNQFLHNYIALMTSDVPQHPDTYAEAYHRDFFTNVAKGLPANQCGALTHNTDSIGGLVATAPIAIAQLLMGCDLPQVQQICREHLWLTHPSEKLATVCDAYVALINALLFRNEAENAKSIIAKAALETAHLDVNKYQQNDDNDVIGNLYTKACPTDDSWPSLLYLAYKYNSDAKAALLANTNVGGENCHRGFVLGVILGLSSADFLPSLFEELTDATLIDKEIMLLVESICTKA